MMYLVVALAGLLGLGSADENRCACTGSNAGIPDGPHKDHPKFGKSCGAWDDKLGNCIKKNNDDIVPLWCGDKWCYVQEGCTYDGEKAKPSTYKDSGLFYSYEVCGNEDRFDAEGFQYTWKPCPPRTHPVDVYFAIDESGSITEKEWREMQVFMMKLIKKGMVHENDRVGIVTWDTKMVRQFDFSNSLDEIVAKLEDPMGMPYTGKGDTHTYSMILKSMDEFNKETRNPDAKRHFILITDGLPDDGHDVCSYEKPTYKPGTEKVIEKTQINVARRTKIIKEKAEEIDAEFSILAIDATNEKKDYPYNKALGCLVVDDKLDVTENEKAKAMFEKLVVMDNFFSFYQYRDVTGGGMCVNGETFSQSYAPTLSPSLYPTFYPFSDSPTLSPTMHPVVTDPPTDPPTDPTSPPTDPPVDPPTNPPVPEVTPKPTSEPTPCNNPAPTCPDCEKKKEEPECVPEYDDDEMDGGKKCSKKSQKKCMKMTACTWNKDKNMCMGTGGGTNMCSGIKYEATCEDLKNCEWDKDMKMCKGSTKGRDYMQTRGPNWWQTCAENFCMKHTWDGGVEQCHYDHAKHGCGCMGITDLKECKKNPECMVNKKCQCVEDTPCEKLNYRQCKADDRCSQCFGGCRRKCSLAPGSELDDNQTLVLNQRTCECEIHNVEKCSKKCCKCGRDD